MRNVLLVLLLTLTASTASLPPRYERVLKIEPKSITTIPTKVPELKLVQQERNLKPLIDALIWVESRGKEDAYCKREDAVGVLQIRPIMVKEVNRILRLQGSSDIYTLEDRWNREKSIQMFTVVANYHHETSSYEKIARCWNGGPKGLQKKQTQKYWRKVQKRLYKDESSSNRQSDV